MIDFQLKHLLIICTLPLSSLALSDYEAALSDSEKAGVSDGKNQRGRNFSGKEFRSASAQAGVFFYVHFYQNERESHVESEQFLCEKREKLKAILPALHIAINVGILKEEKIDE